jgi:riboflavin kinase/FMN adenylyltransferase
MGKAAIIQHFIATMVVTHGRLTGTAASGAPAALTIGNFDGVHRGHRALLGRVVEAARAGSLESCVLTFEPHPREFFAGPEAPARITRLRDKLERIAAVGIGRVHVARFDAAFAALPAGRFVEEVLVRGLGVRRLMVGRDFRFGARRAGDFALLEELGRRHGFGVEAMADVRLEGERVSSSAVRAALQAGDFGRAARLLGHRYTMSGRVAHGAKLGRSLGFPTANIVLRRSPPLAGIFVVEVEGEGLAGTHRAVASVGRRPTVNPVPLPLLEVHLFDWEGELYGRHLRVAFLEKLRNEEKFGDLEALKSAIAHDARRAREHFARHG